MAQIVSVAFHPLFFTLYAFMFLVLFVPFLFAGIHQYEQLLVLARIAINTVFFPFATIFLMLKLGFVSSLTMPERKERIIPYIAISIFYFWNYMALKNLGVHPALLNVVLGITISIYMAFFLNLFYKVSIHTVGAGNFVAIALSAAMMSHYNLEPQVIAVVILAGLIGSARLYLRAHRAADIYSGYMVGMLGQVVADFF